MKSGNKSPDPSQDRVHSAAEKLRALRDRANQALDDHRRRLGAIESELNERVRQLAEDDAAKPASSARPTSSTSESEVAELRRQLDESRDRHQQFVEHLAAARRQLEALQSAPCSACQEADQLLEKREAESLLVRNQLTDAQSRLAKSQAEQKLRQADLADRQAELLDMRDQLDASETLRETAQAQCRAEQVRAEQTAQQLDQCTRQLEQCTDQLETFTTQLEDRSQQFEAAQRAAAELKGDLENRLSELHSDFETANEQRADLAGDLAGSQRQHADAQAELARINGELAAAQAELSANARQRATEEADRTALADQLLTAGDDLRDLEAVLDAARDDLQAAQGEGEALRTSLEAQQAELAQFRETTCPLTDFEELQKKFELALADLQRLKRENAALHDELARRPETQQGESPEVIALRGERDAMAARIVELESAAENPAADSDSQNQLDELQRRFELAVSDVRQLKRENADLREKVSRGESSFKPAAGQLDWAAQKAQLLASLAVEDGGRLTAERKAQHASIEGTIAITDRIVAEKDRELAELRAQWELTVAAMKTSQCIEVPPDHEAHLADDEIIAAGREKIALLEVEWEKKLREAELEFSIERAKLAREQATLKERLFEWEKTAAAVQSEGPAGDKNRRRWRDAFGLHDDAKKSK